MFRGGLVTALTCSGRFAFAQKPSPPRNLRLRAPVTKALLTRQDFQFVGAFALPGSSNPVPCLNGRYAGGQLRLLRTLPYGYGSDILEFSLPTLSAGAILSSRTAAARWRPGRPLITDGSGQKAKGQIEGSNEESDEC